jgi:hypothetical protein
VPKVAQAERPQVERRPAVAAGAAE